MTNLAFLRSLPKEEQAKIFKAAAKATTPRDVKGKTKDRFYVKDIGLSTTIIKAMRDEGHGEKIMTGKGSNSGRWYFPIEILDAALNSVESAHARMELLKEAN